MSDIADWFQRLPLFTRWWFALSLALPLLGRFGLLNPYYMVLLYDELIHKFQIWRPFTAVFYYPINPRTGFHFLLNLYFLYSYSVRLETGTFSRRPADYFFLLLFNWICLVIAGLFMNIMLLMDPMVLSVLYIWCQLNKDVTVTFWFGTQFKAVFLPWVLLCFNMIVGGGGMYELLGILVGHLYYFLAIRYPEDYRTAPLIQTPSILESYFPPLGGRPGFAAAAPPAAGRQQPGRHSWGQGRVLGRD